MGGNSRERLETKLGQNYGASCKPDYRTWTFYEESMVLFNTLRETRRDMYWKLPPEAMLR